MKPAAFSYHAPATGSAAMELLAEFAHEDARILAGGQSLMPMMALRLARPAHLIDINRVAEFQRLDVADGWLRIGPLARHCELGAAAAPGVLGYLLAEVQRHIAHYPIRQRGTFCGSLANADPSSEWCLVAQTLGAEMTASRRGGTRTIDAAEFVQGIMATALAPDEILTEVRLKLLPGTCRAGFFEFSRRAGDYAQAMALAILDMRGGAIAAARVGLGAIEDRPRRLADAEAVLAGQRPTPALFAEAAAACLPGLRPMDDDPYRLELARTAITCALERAA